MADLIAQGNESHQRWRRRLPAGERIVLGRDCGAWSASWDQRISGQHAELELKSGRLVVTQLPSARNPIFVAGQESRQFTLAGGEHFVIGQTTFTLSFDSAQPSLELPQPVEEQTFTQQYLHRVRYHNADQRLEVLSRLPELISGAADEHDLALRLVNLLLAGIPRAHAAALVICPQHTAGRGGIGDLAKLSGAAPPSVLHWDRRLATGGDFQPSQRLILEAARQGQSVLHVWGGRDARRPQFTMGENLDWAFCTPLVGPGSDGWAIYVTGKYVGPIAQGKQGEDTDLREEVKFAELVAATLSSLRQVRSLQRKQDALSQFFAPAVLQAMTGADPDVVLAPRETDVSVLFCDLRGFSLAAERNSADLLGLLRRVSQALGVMTHQILDQGGVVGDFQGDAAMGFWGWPFPQADAVERTCRAALAIRAEFEAAARTPHSTLANFRMGIGISTGRAVAGRIGTTDQVKVTVFGPVVNLAARLEGMTKLLQAPILLDETTAAVVRERLSPAVARSRRLAKVRPYGLDLALEVTELLPPEKDGPELSDTQIAAYERGLDAFVAGEWTKALEHLHLVPPQDRVKDFLTVYIAQHNRTPPSGWDGVIPLSSKQ